MWPNIHALQQARLHGTGKGIKVAILDTGIDQQHAGLSAARFGPAVGLDSKPNGVALQRCSAGDIFGHGTAIAGIIHDLAPEAELLSIRVLGSTKLQHRHELIKLGALHALEKGIHILNCSFGIPGAPYSLPAYKFWTDKAFALDRHIVAASSNQSPDDPQWPATFAQVLSATAAPLRKTELRFRPDSIISFEAAGMDIPVLAPGDGAATLTGSSFAAAHLSGILARILSEYPDLSPSFAHDALRHLSS